MGKDMSRKANGKLAYKLIASYLMNHIALALSILLIAGKGLSLIEGQFFEKYKSSVEEAVDSLNTEILQLKSILTHTLQDENVLMLRERKEQQSFYDQIQYKLKIKDNVDILASQYRLIEDMGIYIPEYNMWINARDWFSEKEAPSVKQSGGRLELKNHELYLLVGNNNHNIYSEGYVQFDAEELKQIQNLSMGEDTVTQIWVNGEVWVEQGAINENIDYRDIQIKSELYPFEVRMFIPTDMISFRKYLYILGAISIVFLILTTIFFARYLNKAIHQPMQNMVSHIEGLNEGNYKEQLTHQGIDEFNYVTSEFNRMKQNLEIYIEKSYEQEISMKQMELDHLQEQIKPHFLYNCFFNISNLCKTYDVEKVERLSLALARYYRYITRTGQSLVSLQAEYDHMKNYLMVQKIRFEDRVEICMEELPESGKDVLVPRLILQPIVENAYKYVFEHVEKDGKLAIYTQEEEESIRIRVEDSGYQTTDETLNRAKEALEKPDEHITGLGNLQKRLQFLDSENGILIERSKLGGISNTLIVRKKRLDYV